MWLTPLHTLSFWFLPAFHLFQHEFSFCLSLCTYAQMYQGATLTDGWAWAHPQGSSCTLGPCSIQLLVRRSAGAAWGRQVLLPFRDLLGPMREGFSPLLFLWSSGSKTLPGLYWLLGWALGPTPKTPWHTKAGDFCETFPVQGLSLKSDMSSTVLMCYLTGFFFFVLQVEQLVWGFTVLLVIAIKRRQCSCTEKGHGHAHHTKKSRCCGVL